MVPKVATAYSFTGVGVASMTVPPMATSGEDSGRTSEATSSAVAMPPAAASSPLSAGRIDVAWESSSEESGRAPSARKAERRCSCRRARRAPFPPSVRTEA